MTILFFGCTTTPESTENKDETTLTEKVAQPSPDKTTKDSAPKDYTGVYVNCAYPDTSPALIELKKSDGTTTFADFPECDESDFIGKEFKVTHSKQMVESCLDPMCDETKKEEQWVSTATLNDGRPESYFGTLTDCEEPDWGGSLAVLQQTNGETTYASFKKCDSKKHKGKRYRVTYKKEIVESCLDAMCDQTQKEEKWVEVLKQQ